MAKSASPILSGFMTTMSASVGSAPDMAAVVRGGWRGLPRRTGARRRVPKKRGAVERRAERRSRGEREARASVSASKQGSGLWTIAPAEKAAGRRLCGKTATRSRSRRGFARAGLGRTDARGAASHPREERVKSSCVRGAESARAVQSWPAPRGRRRKPPRAFSRERRRGGREGRFWRFWRRYQRNTSARSIAPSRVLSRAPPRLRHVSRARFEPISTRRGSTRRERRSRCSP